MRTIRFAAFVLFLSLCAGHADAYQFARSHLFSPLFLHGGRLFFVQNDRRLTVIDVADGSVVFRGPETQRHEFVRFEARGKTVVGVSRHEVFVVDGMSGGMLWTRRGDDSLLAGDVAIIRSGRTLEAFRLEDGERVWRSDLTGDFVFGAANGNVYAFSAFSPPNNGGFLVCLDAADGKTLWWAKPGEGEEWTKAGLDADGVYVLAGSTRRAVFTGIRAWAHDGVQLPELPVDKAEKRDPYFIAHWEPVLVRGREIWLREETAWDDPCRSATVGEIEAAGLPEDATGDVYPVSGAGELLVYPFERSSPKARWFSRQRFAFLEGGMVRWRGTPGYLDTIPNNRVERIASDGEVVVVAASLGQIECIERESGRSRWIYVFPVRRRELSGPYALKPWRRGYYVDDFRRYREETAGIGIIGTAPDDGYGGSWNIVLDPASADNHYHEKEYALLRLGFFVYAVSGLMALIGMLFELHPIVSSRELPRWTGRIRPFFSVRLGPHFEAVGYLIYCCLLAFLYYQAGGYSLFVSLSLKVLTLFSLFFAAYNLRLVVKRGMSLGTVVFAVLFCGMLGIVFLGSVALWVAAVC